VDQPLLYPKYDYIKASKGVTILKGPVEKKKLEAIMKQREDFEQKNYETKMEMLRTQKQKETGGIKIAPTNFSHFTDKHLERLIRHLLKKNTHLLKNRKYI
jgi:hypothetical protein